MAHSQGALRYKSDREMQRPLLGFEIKDLKTCLRLQILIIIESYQTNKIHAH